MGVVDIGVEPQKSLSSRTRTEANIRPEAKSRDRPGVKLSARIGIYEVDDGGEISIQ